MLMLNLLAFFFFANHCILGEFVKDPTLCGRLKCQVPPDRKFKYLEDIYYQYKYRAEVKTHLGKNSWYNNESRLFIDADLTLNFVTPCEGSLRFGNVSITHDRSNYQLDFPDRAAAEFKNSIENHPLRFSFDDGIIRELCPTETDEIWALNIRRGVLSMFQNSMLRFDVDRRIDELDVNGICDTQYRLYEAHHTSLIIRKNKELMGCQYNTKHFSFIQSQTYKSSNPYFHGLKQPLLFSENECEITIDRNIYRKVKCHDYHQFKPSSNGKENGIQTEINCVLELINEFHDTPYNDEDTDKQDGFVHSKRTTLIYNHTKSVRTIYGELRISRDALKNLCILSASQELNHNFSEIFMKFIHSARMLDYQGLTQLYYRAQSICKTGRKYIIDALPFLGTNAAVNLMKDLIIKKSIEQKRIASWITSFSFIPHPNRFTIYALAPLLEFQSEISDTQFILTYSSVIHGFCNNYGPHCMTLEPVKIFVKYIEKNVQSGCSPRPHNVQEIIQTLEILKAVGNSGIETKTLIAGLKKCFNDSSGFIPMQIKVAAIDAHRRFHSCQEFRDEYFLKNFRNFTVDTELRIASFLQIIKCPDYNVIKVIRQTLEEEEVNQVGSFVWSHLKNMLSSSSPTRIEIQSLLTDRNLGNKFNNDFRKFSRDYESSFFSEEYNIGGEYQTSVIFSPKSYIPRTLFFNMTVNLFGESINFLEVGLRFEGLEFYSEKFFSPDGPLSKIKAADYVRRLFRFIRSANSEQNVNDYWEKIKSLPNVIDNNFVDPRISLSYKIFGNEIKFIMLNGDEEIRNTLNNFNPWEKIKEILAGREIVHYENTVMFLDSSYVIPTVAGLPLRLDLSGLAACNIMLSGILKSQKLMTGGEFQISGKITPGASIDITGAMIVDGFFKSTGIKFKSTMFSTGAVEADLDIKGLKLIRLSWKIPNNETEIFSLSTDVSTIVGIGAEVEEHPISISLNPVSTYAKNNLNTSLEFIKNTTCSWSPVNRLIGLEICVDYQFPKMPAHVNTSYFFLIGPTKFKLSIIKSDPTAEKYLLEYKWERTKTKSIVKFAFDTPGSKMQREMSVVVLFDSLNHNVTLTFKSKGNSLVAQGTYKKTDNETCFNIGLDSEGMKHFDAIIGYSTKKTKHTFSIFPKFRIAINNEQIVNLSGTIRNQDKSSTTQCDINLWFETKNLSSNILGYVVVGNTSILGNIKIEYRSNGKLKNEIFQTEFSLINQSTKTLTYKAADIKLHSSANPQLNIIAGLRYQLAVGHVELQFEANTRPHLRDAEKHKLIVQFIATYTRPYFQTEGSNISSHIAITKPAQGIDFKIGMNHFSISSETKTRFLIRYAPEKEISLHVDIMMPRGTLHQLHGRANLTIPNFNSFLLNVKIIEQIRNQYKVELTGTFFSGHNISVIGLYHDRSTVIVTNHDLKINFASLSLHDAVDLNCNLYIDTTDFKFGFAVERIGTGKYSLDYNHTVIAANHFRSYFECMYKNSTHSIFLELNLHREAILKLHFDKWRDIIILLIGDNQEMSKEYGIEVAWDVNRNPNLKFVTNVKFNRHVSETEKNISAITFILYPGRQVTASCFFALKPEKNYIVNAFLEWEANRAIKLSVRTDYSTHVLTKKLKIESQLLTPFENWKRTSINGEYLQHELDLNAGCSIYWHDSQFIILNFTEITRTHDNYWEVDLSAKTSSTLEVIKHVEISLKHECIREKRADSQVMIKYGQGKTINVRSIWFMEKNQDDKFNITGNFRITSSFLNYHKSDFKCYLNLESNWKFYAVAYLDFQKKKYTGHLIGDLRRMKESMIQFNATTPFEKYLYVRGNFGLSAKNRHIVSKITTPTSQLGFEIIFQLMSENYDFHIKFFVAAPVEFFQRALFIAKMNHHEADFQIAYNNLTTGVQGIWFYESLTCFHYSYTLFTPIQGLNKIGVITKLILSKKELHFYDIDTEFSVRVADLNIGMKALTETKFQPPVIVSVKLHQVLSMNETEQDITGEIDNSETNFHWQGEISLDTVVIETTSCSIDFDRDGTTDKINGYLKLPFGNIIFEDIFYLEDFLHIRNDLSIDTPFNGSSEIFSSFFLVADLENFMTQMNLGYNNKNNTVTTTMELAANRSFQQDEEDNLLMISMELNFKYPMDTCKNFYLKTILEVEDHLYKFSISQESPESLLSFNGSLKHDINYFDVCFQTKVNSSFITIPAIKIDVKRDLSKSEKYVKFIIELQDENLKNELYVLWSSELSKSIQGSVVLQTYLEPFLNTDLSFFFNDTLKIDKSLYFDMKLNNFGFQNYSLTGQMKDEKIEMDLIMPISNHIVFKGNVTKINDKTYLITGDLKDMYKSYKVKSYVTFENDVDYTASVYVLPVEIDNFQIMKFRLKTEKYNLILEGDGQQIKGKAEINLINRFNWDLEAELSLKNNDRYHFTTFMNVQVNGNTTVYFDAKTPLKNFEKLTSECFLLYENETGSLNLKHSLNNKKYSLSSFWRLIYLSDMIVNISLDQSDRNESKDFSTVIFYTNPNKTLTDINMGLEMIVNKIQWEFGTNASLSLQDQNNFNGSLKIKLPAPYNDEKNFLLSFHATDDYKNMSYIIGYSTDNIKSNYSSNGSVKISEKDINGHLKLIIGSESDNYFNNLFNITFNSTETFLKYSLITPKYAEEETLLLLLSYNTKQENLTLINTEVYCPGSEHLGTASISYESLINVNGTIKISKLFSNISDAQCDFIVSTTNKQNKRFLRLGWMNHFALLDSSYVYQSKPSNSNLDGYMYIEIPLNTQHMCRLNYGYQKQSLETTGFSDFFYNGNNVVKARYNSKSELKNSYEKNNVVITIESPFRPIGISYISQYENGTNEKNMKYVAVELIKMNIYQPTNISALNISGESLIRTTLTGKEIELTAVHFNRTVVFRTSYDSLPGKFNQSSRLFLEKDAWISYYINIANESLPDSTNKSIILKVSYPKRNFTLNTSYLIKNSDFKSNAILTWKSHEKNLKTLGVCFDWTNYLSAKNIPNKAATLTFKHPSFSKDVRFIGKFGRNNEQDLLNVGFMIEYSPIDSDLFAILLIVRDESNLLLDQNYKYMVAVTHPKTQLKLDIKGNYSQIKQTRFNVTNSASYKRSFLPGEICELFGRLDLKKVEIELSQNSNDYIRYFQSRFYPAAPEYRVNGSMISGSEHNVTGEFFINLDEKLTWMFVNFTPDAIESLKMYGKVPDVRNAEFSVWRTYDQDLTVYDIAFYLRLNHSRLITSKLKWRPELKADIKNMIKNTLIGCYENIKKDFYYWRQYIRSETVSVMTDVWADAQDELKEFIEDFYDLKIIEEDLHDLKIYMNNSFNANEFYIKDIVTMGLYIIDELSLSSHIQSLPNIINEIWELMGDSGEVIRKSLIWIIETIKNIYQKLSEIISAIFRGESLDQIANIIGNLVSKYDVIIKELHVSFIRYIEYLYNKIHQAISLQWQRFLIQIEPMFIQLAHYLETVGWKAIQEFFNFLYDRKIELISSPYYDQLSNITQDIDKFYRDIKSNDIITNIKNYSRALIQFIKERYFTLIPFGTELKDIVDKIVAEIQEIQKLPSVKYVLEKIQQFYYKIETFMVYFKVRERLESTVKFIHLKIVDISQTALQADSRYREAKTKFIYDPNHGIMLLEQKLPMSWHAFNQTPEFQEIPEFRAVSDFSSYFTTSNTTFWTLYYHFKPLIEPENWFPPFKAHSMIIGMRHFRTFDGSYYPFTGTCTYVAAYDFVHGEFAIIIKYAENKNSSSHNLIILAGNSAIQLDLNQNEIKQLKNNADLPLPAELNKGNLYVYREENIIIIESKKKELRVECNLKYKVCKFDLSGWYYGKTAGLLGTMNNEKFDDTLASYGLIEKNITKFIESWSIDKHSNNCPKIKADILMPQVGNSHNSVMNDFCTELFLNKSSQFIQCFNIVEPTDFHKMCLSSISIEEVCSVAMAYLQTCAFHDTYLRIPDKCTFCSINESYETKIPDGDFRKLEKESVPNSTDIVFIVEAKECNRDIRKNRNIDQLVTQINKELEDNKLTKNRWTLVIFGGSSINSKPRSLILKNQIFTTNISYFANYFDHISIGNGSEDIFEAIRFATQLIFRAGVSKTFILLPCSDCEPEKQTLDYSVLYHVLQEHGIRLHLLMNGDFKFKKTRLNKIFYGLDATRSYTKADSRNFSGNIELRRQVKLSKKVLGYCTPLSLETNGTIFTVNKLRPSEKPGAIKKFISVFAQRIVLTAQPNPCQLCECIANNDGITKMECSPCDYPLPVMINFETFNGDDFTAIQSIDVDYGSIDADEE